MEMTLNLPRNYVEIEEEEMMYLDGGKRYYGNQGWAAVSAMAYGGATFKYGSWAAIKAGIASIGGGPIGWICSFILGIGSFVCGYVGGKFLAASKTAAYYMARYNTFNLSKGSIFSIMAVSR